MIMKTNQGKRNGTKAKKRKKIYKKTYNRAYFLNRRQSVGSQRLNHQTVETLQLTQTYVHTLTFCKVIVVGWSFFAKTLSLSSPPSPLFFHCSLFFLVVSFFVCFSLKKCPKHVRKKTSPTTNLVTVSFLSPKKLIQNT